MGLGVWSSGSNRGERGQRGLWLGLREEEEVAARAAELGGALGRWLGGEGGVQRWGRRVVQGIEEEGRRRGLSDAERVSTRGREQPRWAGLKCAALQVGRTSPVSFCQMAR